MNVFPHSGQCGRHIPLNMVAYSLVLAYSGLLNCLVPDSCQSISKLIKTDNAGLVVICICRSCYSRRSSQIYLPNT
jgi:hypothetical protein